LCVQMRVMATRLRQCLGPASLVPSLAMLLHKLPSLRRCGRFSRTYVVLCRNFRMYVDLPGVVELQWTEQHDRHPCDVFVGGMLFLMRLELLVRSWASAGHSALGHGHRPGALIQLSSSGPIPNLVVLYEWSRRCPALRPPIVPAPFSLGLATSSTTSSVLLSTRTSKSASSMIGSFPCCVQCLPRPSSLCLAATSHRIPTTTCLRVWCSLISTRSRLRTPA
jgi:hypothetical protein